METNALAERERFVRAMARGDWTMTALCARFGVTRPTGYKWWRRYQAEGATGLRDRSRAPHDSPDRTPAEIETAVIALRRQYGWGAKKLREVLAHRHPHWVRPACSTVNTILARHGLLRKRRGRTAWPHPGTVPLITTAPNEVWPADFKGQFKTRDGRYCYPLTITDHFSRRVLAIAGFDAITGHATQAVFRRVFREVGLPEAIRTDNGTPFASIGLHGLSALAVWWMQLGITHQRIRPARPQDNGTHERMHRELKREPALPAAQHRRAQQARFDHFRACYNAERPHEALGLRTPDTLWCPSPRPFPERITGPAYPAHWEVRRVDSGGTIRFRTGRVYIAHALRRQDLGLEPCADGVWRLVYYRTVIGTLDERTHHITGVGRL